MSLYNTPSEGVCCEEERKYEESAVLEEVLDSVREMTYRINRIKSKEMREKAVLAFFNYLGKVEDLETCGVKLAQIKMAIAKMKDQEEEKEEKEDTDAAEAIVDELAGLLD